MADLLIVFESIFVLAFAILSLLAGLFTAYFGSGKSRVIGGGLVLIGLIALVVVLWFTGLFGAAVGRPLEWDMGIVVEGTVAVVAAIVGGLVAIGIFLGAIMKS